MTNPHANDLDVFVDGYVIVSSCLVEMESLSQISEYLKNLEDMFKESGDSLEKLESMLEKAKLERRRRAEWKKRKRVMKRRISLTQ